MSRAAEHRGQVAGDFSCWLCLTIADSPVQATLPVEASWDDWSDVRGIDPDPRVARSRSRSLTARHGSHPRPTAWSVVCVETSNSAFDFPST